MPFIGVEGLLYDDENTQKAKIDDMMQSMTYNGYALHDKEAMEISFPTSESGFDVNNFLSFLAWPSIRNGRGFSIC